MNRTALNMFSYGRLERSINNVARKVLSLGISRGNFVAVFVEDGDVQADQVHARAEDRKLS